MPACWAAVPRQLRPLTGRGPHRSESGRRDAPGSVPAAGSNVVGGGVDGMATRSASTSCDSDVMRTLVSSTRSLTMRRSLPMPSTVSFWSAKPLRVAPVWSSARVESCLSVSLICASAAASCCCSCCVCSCSMRMSAIICISRRDCAAAGAAVADRAATTRVATRACRVMPSMLPGYLAVITKCARRFFDHAASSWPCSKGNSLP